MNTQVRAQFQNGDQAVLAAARGVSLALSRAGYQALFAGGCVRDALLGRPLKDIDIATSATPDQVEADLMRIVPPKRRTRAHHWLILHGRYVCVARRPRCEACLIADLCPSRELFTGA